MAAARLVATVVRSLLDHVGRLGVKLLLDKGSQTRDVADLRRLKGSCWVSGSWEGRGEGDRLRGTVVVVEASKRPSGVVDFENVHSGKVSARPRIYGH